MPEISVIFECPEYVLVTDQRLPSELKSIEAKKLAEEVVEAALKPSIVP